VRKPKNRSGAFHRGGTVSPYPQSFKRSKEPVALKREISTDAQKNWAEETILYGEDDALPLRIAQAVEESPAATACIDTTAQFIKGAGFSEPSLMKQKINKTGETLWQLHCKISDSIALFWGFAVNLKYNSEQEITNAYDMSFESLRFVKPKERLSAEIECIKYNPYFGTGQYNKDYTSDYPLYNKEKVQEQAETLGIKFPGQVYYYGKTSPLYRFYPVPKYWSAKKWIDIDGKIQNFHSKNLSNGFFQSVLMNVIGDPNQASKNPKYMRTTTDSAGNTIQESTKTVGEEFTEMMSEAFSGDDKAGNVMALWSGNHDTAAKLQTFPSNTNADLFTTLQDITTKNITIATKTPSILANISEGVSLGSSGSEIQKAIELMQSRVVEWQQALEDFYNDVLLPGMGVAKKVKIINFNPVSEPAEIKDNIWEFLNEDEKIQWVKMNYPDIKINRIPLAAAAPIDPVTGQPAPAPVVTPPAPTGNSALKDLKIADLNKIQKIVARFNLSQINPSDAKALTFEQAKQILAGYGFTDEEINAWLVTPEELTND
jgi:hypothetical protein